MLLRRVRLFVASSLDGFIAGPDGALDWLFTDDDYGYDAFAEQVDTIVMGRHTYDTVAALREWPYVGKQVWVFTHAGEPPTDPRVTFTHDAPAEWLMARFAGDGRDVGVVGGGELIGAFLDASLVDEIEVALHPVILGHGTPLVPAGTRRHALRLVSAKPYRSGLLLLTYVVTR